MDFNADHFALFELPRAFRLESALLDKRYREILALVHPDKFAHASDVERRLSLQWATRMHGFGGDDPHLAPDPHHLPAADEAAR